MFKKDIPDGTRSKSIPMRENILLFFITPRPSLGPHHCTLENIEIILVRDYPLHLLQI